MPTDTPPTAPHTRRIGGGPLVAVALPLLLVGYVLSVGPATRLAFDGYIPVEVWATAYWPANRLGVVGKPVDDALTSYVEWWGVPVLNFYLPRR